MFEVIIGRKNTKKFNKNNIIEQIPDKIRIRIRIRIRIYIFHLIDTGFIGISCNVNGISKC